MPLITADSAQKASKTGAKLKHSPQKLQDSGSDTSSCTHSWPGVFGPRTGGRYCGRSTRAGQNLFRDGGRCFMGGGSDFTVFRGLYIKSNTVDENSIGVQIATESKIKSKQCYNERCKIAISTHPLLSITIGLGLSCETPKMHQYENNQNIRNRM